MKARHFGQAGSLVAVLAMTMAAGLAPAPAHAHITYYTSTGDFTSHLPAPDANILFNDTSLTMDGNPVKGDSNTHPTFVVDFKGDVDLLANGGQARIEGDGDATEPNGGGKDNDASTTFKDLTISLDDPLAVFRTLQFNINPHNNSSATDTITLTGTNLDSPGESLFIPANGLTFFGVIATGNETLKSVELSGDVNIDDVRQVRIGGISKGDIIGVPNTPEPCTLALLGTGALPMLGVLRRRRKS